MIVQKGTAMSIGLGGYTYTGYCVESADLSPTAELEEIKCESDEVETILISNPGDTISFTMLAKSGTSLTIDIGDVVTINSITDWVVTDYSVNYNPKITRVSMTCIRYDSLTPT